MQLLRHHLTIAPGVHDVARLVEFHDCRRGLRDFRNSRVQVVARQDEDVVVRINAHAAELSRDPPLGQRLGPRRIDLELRAVEGGSRGLRTHLHRAPERRGKDHRRHQRQRAHASFRFHYALLSCRRWKRPRRERPATERFDGTWRIVDGLKVEDHELLVQFGYSSSWFIRIPAGHRQSSANRSIAARLRPGWPRYPLP